MLTGLQVRLIALQIRIGWWLQRRRESYPISMWRALTSQYPRFSAYNEHEAGCPEWAKKDYESVRN